MPEFQCGSPVCHSKFSAGTKHELMEKVAEHVRTVHHIPAPTQSILSYLEATAVTEDGATQSAG
jgi:predicted small metal-binding protein